MSLFDIYKAKTLGAGTGSLFDAKAGGKLNKDAWKKGFNKWDEEWESGYWSPSTGLPKDGTNVRSKNLIPVEPSTTYYLKTASSAMVIIWFDAEENVLGYNQHTDSTTTSHANAKYARFYMQLPYGTTYNNDLCINVSGEHDGEYVPYNG